MEILPLIILERHNGKNGTKEFAITQTIKIYADGHVICNPPDELIIKNNVPKMCVVAIEAYLSKSLSCKFPQQKISSSCGLSQLIAEREAKKACSNGSKSEGV
jgi:hypothetical protein